MAPEDLEVWLVSLESMNLTELAKTVSEEMKRDLEERLRPYRTLVTAETLRTPVP
jgi:hypothetical protein